MSGRLLYVDQIGDHLLRFYRNPHGAIDMPWASLDDIAHVLAAAVGMPLGDVADYIAKVIVGSTLPRAKVKPPRDAEFLIGPIQLAAHCFEVVSAAPQHVEALADARRLFREAADEALATLLDGESEHRARGLLAWMQQVFEAWTE